MQEKTGSMLETVKYGSQKTKSSGSNQVSFIVNSYYIFMMYRLITIQFQCKNIDKQQKRKRKKTRNNHKLNRKTTMLGLGMSGMFSRSASIQAGSAEKSKKFAWGQKAERTGVCSTQMETRKI